MTTKNSPITHYKYLMGLYRNRLVTKKKRGEFYETTEHDICKEHEQKQYKKILKSIKAAKPDINIKNLRVSEKRWQELYYFNPFRIIPCHEATLVGIEAFKLRLKDMHMFTVIEGKHETNNKDFQLDLEKIKRKYRLGLKGYNYIGMIELAYFKNAEHDGGELIAPHFQGIMWGELTRKDKKALNKKFSGGRNQATGFYSRKVYNLAGAVSYMHKLPVYGYKLKKKGSYAHTAEYLKNARLYFLYKQLKDLKFADMFVSGGEGVALRDTIISQLKDKS